MRIAIPEGICYNRIARKGRCPVSMFCFVAVVSILTGIVFIREEDTTLVIEIDYDGPEMRMLMDEMRKWKDRELKGEIIYVLNETRFARLQKAYAKLLKLAESGTKIKLESNPLMATDVLISVEARYISVMDMPTLLEFLQLASNVDIVPIDDGEKVSIGISFDGVAKAYKLKPLKDRMKIIKE